MYTQNKQHSLKSRILRNKKKLVRWKKRDKRSKLFEIIAIEVLILTNYKREIEITIKNIHKGDYNDIYSCVEPMETPNWEGDVSSWCNG